MTLIPDALELVRELISNSASQLFLLAPQAPEDAHEPAVLGVLPPPNGYATKTSRSTATGATIRETSGNGFVTQIDVIDTMGNFHTVWAGADTSLVNVPFDFGTSWKTTSFLVSGLKVYVNTNHTGSWGEIDSIRLAGDTVAPPAPVPEPATWR